MNKICKKCLCRTCNNYYICFPCKSYKVGKDILIQAGFYGNEKCDFEDIPITDCEDYKKQKDKS